MLIAPIPLTHSISHNPSLSVITLGKSSRLHPMSI